MNNCETLEKVNFCTVISANKFIRDYLYNQDISQAKLARMLKEKPQVLGEKLRSDYMAVEMVEKISIALKHNFFKDMSDAFEAQIRKSKPLADIISEPTVVYGSLEQIVRKILKEELKKE